MIPAAFFRPSIVFRVVVSTIAALVANVLSADEYDDLRLRWVEVLTGGSTFDAGDPDFAAALDDLDLLVVSNGVSRDTVNGTAFWDKLNTSPSRTFLWSDLASTSNSGHVTSSYNRLRTMARAYSTHGSSLEGNTALLADILSALDWMHTNRYNASSVSYGNWWDWQIGTPIQLNDITALLYGQLTTTQIANFMAAVEAFCPTPHGTGANRMWRCKVVGVRGVLVKDSAKIVLAKNAISSIFNYSVSGEGFYTDGSFIQHSRHPYNGGYGQSLIIDVTDYLYLYSGSSWDVTDPDRENVYNWLYSSFEPFIYRGETLEIVRGREVSRHQVPSHVSGRRLIGAFLRASQFAPTADATYFKRAAKYWLQSNMAFSSDTAGLSIYDTVLAKGILSDSSITSRGALHQVAAFPSMDRLAAERSAWGAGLAIHSSRIYNFESINGENLKGWRTGDGMLYVYTTDHTQFSDNFWPTVAPHRLPGTTVEANVAIPQSQTSNTAAVGVMENWSGEDGVALMNLDTAGRSLRGKKAWFFFDDEIVCLGTGITATGGATLETIIENRKLNTVGSNAFTINGSSSLATLQSAPGIPALLANVSYAHLAGTAAAGDGLGYYFPGGATLTGFREARTANWSSINTAFPNTTNHTNNYLTLWFDHGVNPASADYSYAVLPAATAAATAAYGGAPDFVILENTTEAQAVKETSLGEVSAVFWGSGSKTIGTGADSITSSTSAAVVARVQGDELQVSVADYTQTNSGSIIIELGRGAAGVIDQDSSVSLVQLTPSVQFSVDVSGKRGRAQRIRFALAATAEHIVDNTDAGFSTTGTWTTSSGLPGYHGTNYLHDGSTAADASKTATWISPISTTGTYDVFMRWTSYADRPDAAPVEVNYFGGIANLTVNQQTGGGTWVKIGTWSFTGGSGDYVKISGADAGYTIADAVRWVPVTPVSEYIVDNTDAGFSTIGSWTTSTGVSGYYGSNYRHDGSSGTDASKSATWTSPITTTGTYDVFMRWTSWTDRPDAAPIEVNYNGGIATLTVNQQVGGGTWVYLGTWSFTGGSGDYVKITGADAGYTIADAVRWVEQ